MTTEAVTTQTGTLGEAWLDRDLSWLEFNRRVLHEGGPHAIGSFLDQTFGIVFSLLEFSPA